MKNAKQNGRQRPNAISAEEREQVRIRRDLGHDFALRTDELGRHRLVAGTEESKRVYEISNGGYIALGGIARIRTVCPLKGISSLTEPQRNAGAKYRDAFEFCDREGLKASAMQERVDGGSPSANVAARLVDASLELSRADAAMGHWEIVGTVRDVCGRGLSIKGIADRERDRRETVLTKLKLGLDLLAVHYLMIKPKKSSTGR